MASPAAPPPAESSGTEGEGLLETIGAQLATLAAQVSEIDQRVAGVESGSPSRLVEVQLSPETVAQIADALAALQAAGSQALDEAFKTASDDLTEALSGLVRTEISRTLSDAGYTVEVTEIAAPAIDDELSPYDTGFEVASTVVEGDVDELPEAEPVAASVRSGPDAAAMPSIVAPLAANLVDASGPTEVVSDSTNAGLVSAESIRDASDEGADDDEADLIDADRAPLGLDELDDPFLDALIRKEPLSA